MAFIEHSVRNVRILIGAVQKSKILVGIPIALENTHLLGKAQELAARVKKLTMWMHGKALKNHLPTPQFHVLQLIAIQ